MKICEKCGSEFKTHIKIDGKSRNLKSRKYCLDCSPFGVHNTRKLIDISSTKYGKCKVCGREYVYVRKSGHSKDKCNTCWTNEKRREMKLKALDYLGNKCSVCGYDRSIYALEFHHRDPNEKEFTLSSNNYKAWAVVKKELDKCVLVCANCHREIHEGVIGEEVITSDSKSEFASSSLA